MAEKKIVMPVGPTAGGKLPLPAALEALASEMLGIAADLEEMARWSEDEPGKAAYAVQAELLRKYGYSVKIIALQVDPEGKTWPALDGPELAEIARRFKLTLPER